MFSEHCQDARCVNAKRIEYLNEKCKEYESQSIADVNYKTMLYDDQARLLYCYVPKVGTTTMKYLMENSKGACSVEYKKVHERSQMQACGVDFLSHVSNKTERQRKLETYQKILVVRNPYERLYSAYWQKAHLLKRFLRGNTKEKMSDNIPFNVFLVEFIQAMTTNKAKYDVIRKNYHWRNIDTICSPCIVDYHYIFKLDTLSSDSELFLPLFNVQTLPQYNTEGGTTRSHMPEGSIADAMTSYRQISPRIMEDLTKVLQKDLDLFGYGIDMDNGLLSLV